MHGQNYITAVQINKVRHLENLTIPLSSTTRKNLILTGKNGSGKTSLLEAMADCLQDYVSVLISTNYQDGHKRILYTENCPDVLDSDRPLAIPRNPLNKKNVTIELSSSDEKSFYIKYTSGNFILACYNDQRSIQMEDYSSIQAVPSKKYYGIDETPGRKLAMYLANMKATQAFAEQKGLSKRVINIENWFQRFQSILCKIFEDDGVKLDFNIENFQFSILQPGREPFDFNTMSSGYAAVFEIINDLIMRMETVQQYDLEGIVLIDEIETHLHLELQKKILPILTELFPNIQFIVSTHSPFILNSLENAVVYDLERKVTVQDGLSNLPYEGIVEGYFGADRLSNELRKKYDRYKALAEKSCFSDNEIAEIDELELYLDEIPDYLAIEITSEYRRLKLELNNKLSFNEE